MSAIPAGLLAAYHSTRFRVHGAGGFDLRVGQASTYLAAILAEQGVTSWAFITADNPFSQTLTAAENHARLAALGVAVDALGHVALTGEGIGEDPAWAPEQSLLILGITRDNAIELGHRFEQNAIVFGDSEVPELLLLR